MSFAPFVHSTVTKDTLCPNSFVSQALVPAPIVIVMDHNRRNNVPRVSMMPAKCNPQTKFSQSMKPLPRLESCNRWLGTLSGCLTGFPLRSLQHRPSTDKSWWPRLYVEVGWAAANRGSLYVGDELINSMRCASLFVSFSICARRFSINFKSFTLATLCRKQRIVRVAHWRE